MSGTRSVRRVILFLVCFLSMAPWASAETSTLTLQEVLSSTLRSHPKARIFDAKVDAANSARVSASGAFDLQAFGRATSSPLGKYQRYFGELGVKQPTTAYGIDIYAKYQNGAEFPPYDGRYVTSEFGKVSLGVVVPLLRGGHTDSARFARRKAELEQAIAEQERRVQRAELLAQAAEAWWRWVVTGKKLEAQRKVLSQAEERRDFLREQARVGAIAPVEVLDNERLLAARRAKLSVLELKFRRFGLKLGLYRRGQGGEPLPPSEKELPQLSFGALPYPQVAREYQEELHTVPAIQIYGTASRILKEELGLAKNEQLPELNLELFSSTGWGPTRPYSQDDSSLTETNLGGKLSLLWDVQRRKSRGKAGVVRAKLRIVEQETRLLLDSLLLDIESQLMALEAQGQAAQLSQQATKHAEEVRAAERESFQAGQSSVLSLNLRERAVLSAYIAQLDAVFEYQMAWVGLQRLFGRDTPDAYSPNSLQVSFPTQKRAP